MSSDDTERTSFFERRSQSDCVHEQVAKADCECPLYRRSQSDCVH
ncbi:hypothetical protein HMPREF0373_01038 [Eubacterium ramulus ATCC 29099]|uniref:Uncharacterized protein n=1 Tax=Eubacterium ramulus ATCC 29099 TaxID=1256908 RepID=U2RFP8_EUBRA|nr:hypothetical protein HMPREF0373_01038 [Eubacterium ramulus ATCC 29099]